MSALGSLVVKLALEYAQYTQGLDKSEQATLAHVKRVQDALDSMKSRAAVAVGSIAGALAAGLSINAFKGLLDGVVASTAGLHDLAIQSGTTVEALSGLASIGKYSDMGAEQIAASMNKLTKNLTSVTEDSAGTGKAIRLLGLDMATFAAMKPEEQMMAVAKALDRFQDGAGKSAVMMALYGKEGAKMLPMMKDLADVGELQAKVTTAQSDASDNYDDNLKKITASSDAWKKELVMGMIPALDQAAQAYLDVLNGTGGLRDEVRKLSADGSIEEWTRKGVVALTYLSDGLGGLVVVVRTLGDSIGATLAAGEATFSGIAAAVGKAIKGDFVGAYAEMDGANQRANAVWANLGATVSGVWSEQSLGSKIRARMADMQAAGAVAKAITIKPELDASRLGIKDSAAKAAKDGYIELTDAGKAYGHAMAEIAKAQVESEASTESYTRTQKTLLTLFASPEFLAMPETWKQEIIAKAEAQIATEQHAESLKKEAEAAAYANQQWDEYFAQIEKSRLTNEAQIKTAREMLEQIQFETSLLGLNADQRAVATAMRELERQGIVKGTQAWDEYAASIQNAVFDRSAQQANIDFWANIENTAHSVWTSVTDQGQNAWKRIGQTLKSAVLDLLWQITAKQWLIQIGTSMGAGGAGSTAAQVGSSVAASSVASTFLGAASAFGTGAGAAFTSIVNAGVGGWATAAGSLIASGTSAGFMAGVGMLAGPVAAVVAAVSFLRGLDTGGTYHTGGLGSYSAAGGAATGNAVKAQGFDFNLAPRDYRADGERAATSMAAAVVTMLDRTAATFGKKAGYFAATAFADDSSKSGAWGGLMVRDGQGQSVIDWKNGKDKWPGREFADGKAGAEEYAAAVAVDVRDYLLTQTPDWAQQALNALGSAPSLDQIGETVQAINNAAGVMDAAGASAGHLTPWMERIAGTGPLTTAALKAIAEYPNALLQAAGTSRDALIQTFTSGLMSGDPAAAGQAVADQLVASIEQSMMGTAAAQIFDIINAGIVTPMLDAILTGQAVSEAISQQSINAVIEKATKAAQALGELFNNPAFAEAMKNIRTTVSQALGTAGAGLNYKPKYQPENRAAEEAAARAAEQARLEAEREAKAAAEAAARAAQQAAEAAARAAAEYQQALEDAQDYISGIARSISTFLAGLDSQASSLLSYNNAAASFAAQMVLARGGDRQALDNITGSASAYIDAINRESGSSAEARLRIGRVRGQLAGLPASLSPEQFIVNSLVPPLTQIPVPIVQGIAASNAYHGTQMALNAQAVVSALGTGFSAMDLDNDGQLTIAEFKSGMAGKASDAELSYWFDQLDKNHDGVISQLEALNYRSEQSNSQQLSMIAAINAYSTGAGMTVSFSPDDPLRSIFDNIGRTNELLIDSMQMQLMYLLGTVINEDFSTGPQDSLFRGTYTTWMEQLNYLAQIDNTLKLVVAGTSSFAVRGGTPSSAAQMLADGADGMAAGAPVLPIVPIDWAGYGSGEMAEILAELKALRESNERLLKAAEDRERTSGEQRKRMTNIVEKWDNRGLPAERVTL